MRRNRPIADETPAEACASPRGIRSSWRHPPLNIALEEGLRRNLAARGGQGYFLCWRNEPAVIVGRNQDALAELSLPARRRGIPVYRRTSGGGAVYHDEGNLNWSWIVRGGLADRERLLALILGVLRSLGIDAREGPRAGIYVGARKIGGTACATGKGVLLFHGTLLVSTDLDALQDALAAHAPAYAGDPLPGVRSVPSELATISQLRPGLGLAALEAALFAALAPEDAPRSPDAVLDLTPVEHLAQDYARESWIFHRKPPARNRRTIP